MVRFGLNVMILIPLFHLFLLMTVELAPLLLCAIKKTATIALESHEKPMLLFTGGFSLWASERQVELRGCLSRWFCTSGSLILNDLQTR